QRETHAQERKGHITSLKLLRLTHRLVLSLEKELLYTETPSVGLEDYSLQKICKNYNNKPHYVTLYDTADHVPIYSAYTFKRSDWEKRVDVAWICPLSLTLARCRRSHVATCTRTLRMPRPCWKTTPMPNMATSTLTT
uniref:Uncharacterized protein n=1 Tax=Hucho hucho TaxID=62062 RepID=A0A4W5KRU9_9TELE